MDTLTDISGINTSLNLTDNTGTKTCGDNLDTSKFRLEIRKQF